MLVAVWAAAFAMEPCQIEAFGEKAGFIVKSRCIKDFHVFWGDEERDGFRFVFDESIGLFRDRLQQRDGISAGSDGAVETETYGFGGQSFHKSHQMIHGCRRDVHFLLKNHLSKRLTGVMLGVCNKNRLLNKRGEAWQTVFYK